MISVYTSRYECMA